MSDLEAKELMQRIEAELKKGVRRDISKLDKLYKKLDQALGTDLKEEDEEALANYEANRRSRQ